MSRLAAVKNDFQASFTSMVGLDITDEDMINLQDASSSQKTRASQDRLIPVVGNPHKIRDLVNDISDIVIKPEDHKSSKDKLKKSHHVKSKDYLGDKKNRIPSAAELLNGPLRDSYQGLEGAGESRLSYHDFSRNTSKDLSKSVNDNLNIMADSKAKDHGRKGRRGSMDAQKTSAHVINSTLASTIELAEEIEVNKKTPLGVTGKDLNKVLSSNDMNPIKKMTKSKGSIGTAINEPFRKSMENLGLNPTGQISPVPIKAPKNKNNMFAASKAQHKEHEHEKI